MFCFKCGAQIPHNSKFCVNCGTKAPNIYDSPSQDITINDMLIKSPLVSTIIVRNQTITYIGSTKNEEIHIPEITSVSCTPGTTFSPGKLFLSTKDNEYFLNFSYQNNAQIERLCKQLPFYIADCNSCKTDTVVCPNCLSDVSDGRLCPKCSRPLHPKWYQKNSVFTVAIMILSIIFMLCCFAKAGIL